VSTDEVVKYKNKKPVIPFNERLEIVRACRYVDVAVPQTKLDKLKAWDHYKYHTLFVGDDWHGDATWQSTEKQLSDVGVKVVYLPYTRSTSSTLINEVLEKLRN
jgi:glycerol-3-phosphate cytidylyltransferase-like family protein